MHRSGKILMLLFILPITLFAQRPKNRQEVDSLLQILQQDPVDSIKFNINLDIGDYYINQNTDTAILYSTRALEWAKKGADILGEAKALARIGISHSMRNEFSEAMEYLLESQRIFDENPDERWLSMIHNEYGIIHLLQHQLREAIQQFEKSIEYKAQIGDSIGIAKAYNNIGGAYEQLKDLDSSLLFHFKSLDIKERLGFTDGVGYSHNNISSIYNRQGKTKEAMASAQKALSIFEENGNRDGKIYALNMVAEIHRGQEHWDESIFFHKQALDESMKLNIRRRIQEAHRKLAFSYEGKGEYKQALEHERLYRIYKDSVDNLRNVRRIEQVKTDYEIDKRESEIAKQDAQLSQQATFRNALIGGVVLLVVIIGLIYRNQRIKSRSLREKDALLREIHHRVKNNLQVISSLLNMQSREADDPGMQDLIKEGQSRVKAMSLIHQKLYQTESLAEIDFEDYSKQLIEQVASLYKTDGLELSQQINANDIRLDIDTAIPLGLILNELISNSFKYAFKELEQAEIRVDLQRLSSEDLQLTVSDNGAGLPFDFDLESVKSLGLKLVSILTKQLKGNLNFSSDGGTKFEITFKDLSIATG